MKTKPNYEHIAECIMFSPKDFSLNRFDIVFRKGKTYEDIKKAQLKALKNGRGKTEYEISMLELYMKDIFKGA